jgi:hypothetical protein
MAHKRYALLTGVQKTTFRRHQFQNGKGHGMFQIEPLRLGCAIFPRIQVLWRAMPLWQHFRYLF